MFRTARSAAIALLMMACQPAPTQPVAAPSRSPGPSAAETAGWTLIDLPDVFSPWFASGVLADPDGFVVFGGVNDRAAAWTSRDGETWSSEALPGPFGFPERGAASRTATVLLGAGSTDRCAHPFGQSLWRRARGEDAWQAVPFDEHLFCAGGFAEIAATGDAFAVVGMGTGDQPFAWQSVDGITWRDAGQGIPFDTPPSLVTAARDGFLELGRGERTDVRASVDGTIWSAVEAPPLPPAFNGDAPGMSPAALFAAEPGVVAFYQSDGATARSAWRRNADLSWSQIELEGFEPDDVISGGTAIDGKPFLFGSRRGLASVLTSSDLVTWTEVAIPVANSVLGLAAFERRTVLVTHILDPAGGPDVTRAYAGSLAVGGS